MAEPILVPQVGQDLTEARIVALHVKLGDTVKKGDIVAEVESEKATFEVEAFNTGVVLELSYGVGDVATVLQPLMLVGTPGATNVPAVLSTPVPHPSRTGASGPAPASAQILPAVREGVLRSSPLARRLAASKGLDLAAVVGTGPRGAVVMRDVEAAASSIAAAARLTSVAAFPSQGLAIRPLQPGTGQAIVFIHGFGSELSSWRAFIGRLAIGNPMLGIDLPAHGASVDCAAEGFAAIVDAVASSLAGAGHHRFHLVGHSLGAAVGAALTERRDFDVRSLSLIAPAGLGPQIDGDFITGFLGASSEAALSAWMRRLVHAPAAMPGSLVRATLGARQGTTLAPAQAALARSLFEDSTQLFSVRDTLQRYEGPCRIIVGQYDRMIKDQAEGVPGHVALHRLEGVGHLPHIEAPALVGRLVAETVRAAG
jgi:pimeloyl-ACP methyl ester carboxylesterase